MRRPSTIPLLATLWLSALIPARAQNAGSPYVQPLRISAFAGVNATETGLPAARNAGITAGADLGFLPIHGLTPSLELRGTIPVHGGQIASEKNFLGGLKVSATLLGRFHPYADLLAGRGELTYYGAGLQVPGKPIYYTSSHSTVFAGGGGLDFSLSDAWSVKIDAQAQRYATPVTASGHILAAAGMAGLSYRFHFSTRRQY